MSLIFSESYFSIHPLNDLIVVYLLLNGKFGQFCRHFPGLFLQFSASQLILICCYFALIGLVIPIIEKGHILLLIKGI
jgi:hypothetical protein